MNVRSDRNRDLLLVLDFPGTHFIVILGHPKPLP